MNKQDPLFYKYKDNEKIITTINRPTENLAVKHLHMKTNPGQKDFMIYRTEYKFIKDGCDPAFVITKVANELGLQINDVERSLKRIERYLKYKHYYNSERF